MKQKALMSGSGCNPNTNKTNPHRASITSTYTLESMQCVSLSIRNTNFAMQRYPLLKLWKYLLPLHHLNKCSEMQHARSQSSGGGRSSQIVPLRCRSCTSPPGTARSQTPRWYPQSFHKDTVLEGFPVTAQLAEGNGTRFPQ